MSVWWKQMAVKLGLVTLKTIVHVPPFSPLHLRNSNLQGRWVDISKLKPEHGAFVVAWVTNIPPYKMSFCATSTSPFS